MAGPQQCRMVSKYECINGYAQNLHGAEACHHLQAVTGGGMGGVVGGDRQFNQRY